MSNRIMIEALLLSVFFLSGCVNLKSAPLKLRLHEESGLSNDLQELLNKRSSKEEEGYLRLENGEKIPFVVSFGEVYLLPGSTMISCRTLRIMINPNKDNNLSKEGIVCVDSLNLEEGWKIKKEN